MSAHKSGTIMKFSRFWTLCFSTVSVTVCSFAGTGIIGVATAVGTFDINQVRVAGNANLTDGSEVRTTASASQVLLQNGPAVTLGMNSSGLIYRDHLVLQEGATKVDNMNGYAVQADKYSVLAAQPNSRAIVKLEGTELQVASLAGSLNVLNDKGVLLTRIGAGTASAFNRGGQNPSRPASNTSNRPREIALYLLLLASLAGLGLAIDAIVQPGTTSPTSGGSPS